MKHKCKNYFNDTADVLTAAVGVPSFLVCKVRGGHLGSLPKCMSYLHTRVLRPVPAFEKVPIMFLLQ